jgi:hypothetical protein
LRGLFIQSVGASDALERQPDAQARHLRRIFSEPAVMDREDIVCDPQHLRVITIY